MKAIFICFFLSSLSFAADPSIVRVREDKIENCLKDKLYPRFVPVLELGQRPQGHARKFRVDDIPQCENKIEDAILPLRRWEGIDSLIQTSTKEIHIITTPKEWESLWRRHKIGTVPAIDFKNQTVIAVFQGGQDLARPLYGIAVESANSFTFYFVNITIPEKIDWKPKPKIYGRYGIYVFPRITKPVFFYELLYEWVGTRNEGEAVHKFHQVEYPSSIEQAK